MGTKCWTWVRLYGSPGLVLVPVLVRMSEHFRFSEVLQFLPGFGILQQHSYRHWALCKALKEGPLKDADTLVTHDQPYLFATIFKHFIYVCFQLIIFMYENQLKLH